MTDIYLITNNITGKQYVGKTQRGYLKRFEQHCLAYLHGNRTHISCAIHKYGKENFNVQLIKQVPDKEWKYWEQYYIKYYHTHFTQGGYNTTWGGDSNPMDIPSVKRKHYHKCTTPEFRELQRKLSTGKKHSDKTKELCRQNTLNNLDVCIRGFMEYNESKKARVGMIKDGKLLKEFDSASDACRYLGKPSTEAGHILKVCDVITDFGRPAKHFGYNWTRLKQGENMELYMAGMGNMNGKLNIYFAGDYMFPYDASTTDVYLMGYNRLLSYDYQKKLVDKVIERKKALKLYLAGTDKFGEEERRKSLDLYLAGSQSEHEDTMKNVLPSNVLFSYENLQISSPKNLDIYHMFGAKLFIDSGAFSMWTKGVEVDVDAYIKWINKRSKYIDLYGQVDAIPGNRTGVPTPQQVREAAQKTWENYLYMRPKMKNPDGLLYTFHVGEPKEFLKQALEWTDENGKHIPYIALGGMVGKNAQVRRNFLTMCFDIIKKSSNPNVKTHAFGMTSKDLLEEFPITSADSTSWIMTAAMGGVMTDVGNIMVSDKQKNDPTHYSHLPKKDLEKFEEKVCEFGFTLDELGEDRNKRVIHNARYMKDRFSKIKYKPSGRKKLF